MLELDVGDYIIAETISGQVYIIMQTRVGQVIAECNPDGMHIWVLARALEKFPIPSEPITVQVITGPHGEGINWLTTARVKWALHDGEGRLNDTNRARLNAVRAWVMSWDTLTPQLSPSRRRELEEATG